MGGPAIDPETGEFLQPGKCPASSIPFIDCIVSEKVFDQCFVEDVIVRNINIPTGSCEPCENVDLTRIDRVECTVLSAECEVVDVSPPIADNIRIVTVRQDVEMQINLIDDTPTPPVVLCTFTASITDFYNTFQLFVPPPGLVFGPAGGPFVFCEVVSSTCFGIPETVPPGQPVNSVIITVKVCKIIEVTAFVKLLIPNFGFCVPRPCIAAPQQEEIECPPIGELFPPQMDNNNFL